MRLHQIVGFLPELVFGISGAGKPADLAKSVIHGSTNTVVSKRLEGGPLAGLETAHGLHQPDAAVADQILEFDVCGELRLTAGRSTARAEDSGPLPERVPRHLPLFCQAQDAVQLALHNRIFIHVRGQSFCRIRSRSASATEPLKSPSVCLTNSPPSPVLSVKPA